MIASWKHLSGMSFHLIITAFENFESTIILGIAEPREKQCCRIQNTSFSAKICWSNVEKYLYFSLKTLNIHKKKYMIYEKKNFPT